MEAAVRSQRPPSFDELYQAILALPEGITGEIVEDGGIEAMSRPGRLHAAVHKRVLKALGPVDDERTGGWVIELEREVRLLGSRLLVPDLSGWRVTEEGTGFLDLNPIVQVPDWACEILSDTTHRKDRLKKLPLYAEAGVGHIWIVDPDRHSIEVYVPRGGVPAMITTAADADVVRLPPFDLELDLATLWLPRPKAGRGGR